MHKPPPWIHSYPGDVELCQEIGMDGFTLVRLRRNLHEQYRTLSRFERVAMEAASRGQRLGYLTARLMSVWVVDDWGRMTAWQTYCGYTDWEWEALTRSEYPVDIPLVEKYSALFGIDANFLLLAYPPTPATDPGERKQVTR